MVFANNYSAKNIQIFRTGTNLPPAPTSHCTPLGKVWRQSNPYAPGGTPVWTTYTYDALGRTVQIDLPQGGSTSYEYKGETTKITDPAGKWKKYATNAFGKLTLVTEPNPQGGEVTTSYSYDLLDHPLQVSMTRGSTTQLRIFNYDATTQRLTSMSHPETGTSQFYYNADGTLYYRQDAKSQKIYYAYDTFGRVAQISRYLSSGAEDTAQRVTFAYDDSPTNGLGRLSQANWKTGGNFQFAYNYAYTTAGLPTSKKMTVTKTSGSFTQSGQLEATYSYDTEGKLSSMTYPTEHLDDPAFPGQYRYLATTGLTYNYSYDTLGRPNAMSSPAHSRTGNQAVTWVDNVSYGAANEMLGMRYRLDAANGQTPVNYYNETWQYNNRLQLTQLSAAPTGGATTSLTINYVFPTNGNNGMLYQASDNLAGEVTYQYDSLNRLISAATTSNSWGLSFAYDGFGNRTDQTVTKGTGVESHLTYDMATNRISSSGYAYDSNGSLTQMPGASGSVTLEYDIENRLTRYYYAAGGVDERYGYGPSNERVWKGVLNQDLQDEVFFYGIDGKLLGRYRPALSGACGLMMTPLGKNVYFAGKLIRSQDRAVVTDRLGSVRIVYNESAGEQLSKYYPFGEEISPVTAQNRDKYGTYYRDASSSLDYALNRYYSSSSLGRFLTPDPYLGSPNPGNPQTWNRYAYVANDPINKNDPSGLDPFGFGGPGPCSGAGCGWGWDPCTQISYFLGINVCGRGPLSLAVPYAMLSREGGGQFFQRLNKDNLLKGAGNLINKQMCADFLVSVAQQAFLNIAGKFDPNELSPGERKYYEEITATNIYERLQNATFIDAHRPETDRYGNTVNARAEYGNDGAGQSVTFYDSFFGKDSLKQNQITVHEGMHLIFNLGDSDLARAAGSFRGRDSNASGNFQKKLEEHCQ